MVWATFVSLAVIFGVSGGVYLVCGVGVGLGIALVYTPSIGCVQTWFSRRRSLAAALIAALQSRDARIDMSPRGDYGEVTLW